MMTISKTRLLLFILPFWSTGLNGNKVEIIETGLRAEDGSFECGERIVLTCIITAFSQYMLWQNDSSITPLAQCEPGVCLFDEKSEGLFEFTHDTSLAVFNLTIFQTTFVNDGATYKCEDISTGNFSSSTIKVSDYLPITLEENADNLTVTSGCIDPVVEVNIVWFKVKSDTGEESEYNPTTIVKPVKVVCSTENICGLSTYNQITYTIGINQDGDEAYKLKAVLFYNGERKESNTTQTDYMIKEQETSNRQTDNTDNNTNTIAISVGVGCSALLLFCLVSVLIKNHRSICKNRVLLLTVKTQSDESTTTDNIKDLNSTIRQNNETFGRDHFVENHENRNKKRAPQGIKPIVSNGKKKRKADKGKPENNQRTNVPGPQVKITQATQNKKTRDRNQENLPRKEILNTGDNARTPDRTVSVGTSQATHSSKQANEKSKVKPAGFVEQQDKVEEQLNTGDNARTPDSTVSVGTSQAINSSKQANEKSKVKPAGFVEQKDKVEEQLNTGDNARTPDSTFSKETSQATNSSEQAKEKSKVKPAGFVEQQDKVEQLNTGGNAGRTIGAKESQAEQAHTAEQ